jgi:hypothetical protein
MNHPDTQKFHIHPPHDGVCRHKSQITENGLARLLNQHPNGTSCLPNRSISLNLILLDHLFRKEYRYGLNISPFSTSDVTNVSISIEFLLQVDAVELREISNHSNHAAKRVGLCNQRRLLTQSSIDNFLEKYIQFHLCLFNVRSELVRVHPVVLLQQEQVQQMLTLR